ncbi:MAG TPA: ATP-binding protein [Armatimonadota bacterium]|nr:ATP-binding protein [Armatimonadota bacterium]
MVNNLLNWLSSLRVRLVVTYLFVTAFSFILLFLLIMKPVESFLLKREENTLSQIALVLGSTVRDPWRFSEDAWQEDLFWTQRRSSELSNDLGLRIRILDGQGRVLTDSRYGYCSSDRWKTIQDELSVVPSIRSRTEVVQAIHHHYGAQMRPEEAQSGGRYSMYIARPIMRQRPAVGREDLAFIIYINKPVDSVMADLLTLRNLLKVGMIASLLVAILVSIVLSSRLAAGLQSAMRIARAFASGKMDQRMRAKGRDEVGQLGAAFNQMADALQRQEQLRRNLLADVSHELRTPLTAISGCADTLADGALRDDPTAAEHFLSIIHRESQRLQRLVSDILELSKLQAGVIAIPLQPLLLRPLLADAVEIANLHARQEGITIYCDYLSTDDQSDLLILGNEDRLAQALRNLLDNARHHTPEDRMITVSVTSTIDTVVIDVQDEGEGIPAEDIPWVFDRFYRAGKGEKQSGGTGLGLAIVREIMLAHQGKVTVASTVGQGTRFSLHLKKVQADVDKSHHRLAVK